MIHKKDFVIFKIDDIDRDGLRSLIIDIDKNFTYQPTLMVTEIGETGVFEIRDQRNPMITSEGIVYRQGLLIIDMDTSEIAVNDFIEEIALIFIGSRLDFHLNINLQESEMLRFIKKCPDKIETEFKKNY